MDIEFSDEATARLCAALGIEWEPGDPEPGADEVVRHCAMLRTVADAPGEIVGDALEVLRDAEARWKGPGP